MPKNSADIKVRVDALLKSALQQIADEESEGDLSVVVRRGLKDFVRTRGRQAGQGSPVQANQSAYAQQL